MAGRRARPGSQRRRLKTAGARQCSNFGEVPRRLKRHYSWILLTGLALVSTIGRGIESDVWGKLLAEPEGRTGDG